MMPETFEQLIHPTMPLMAQVLFLLVAARVGGELMERVGQPALVGELLAGVLLGPLIFNVIQGNMQLRVVADLGVFFLVLLAGLEMSPDDIWEAVRGPGLKVAAVGFLTPLLIGLWVGWVMHFPLAQMIFFGLCIAITALPISLRLVMDTKLVGTDIGKSIVAVAVVNDIIALLLLGLILEMANVTQVETVIQQLLVSVIQVAFFIALVLIAHRIVTWTSSRFGSQAQQIVGRIVKWFKGQETLFALAILFVLIFASVAETFGLHFLIGAFLGGVLLSREFLGTRNYDQVKRTTSSITMGFLAPVFFGHIGLEISPAVWGSLGLVAVVLAAAVVGKFMGGYIGARVAGLRTEDCVAVGVALNGRGTLDLVIASIALQQGMIGRSLFSALVFMAVITTLLTPWLFKKAHKPPPSGKAAAGSVAAKSQAAMTTSAKAAPTPPNSSGKSAP